jgi:site-specific DNA recombinase
VRTEVPQSAAIYCRISHDPSGERLGVQRQEDDCRAEATRRHWRVSGLYIDDDRSAFSTRKPRPEYQRLLRDIQEGAVDGVMIWRLDRLHRQPRELEEFIVITDKQEVALATVTGDVNLSTTQGRLLARAWGAFAAHESEVKSERLKRAFLERARKGKDAWTIRMFGYQADLHTINPREASTIREAAKRILAGESLNSLIVDFNRRKIRTTKGKVWSGTHLRASLRNPRLAGLTKYHGEIVGKGSWPAILRPVDSARLREIFRDRGRNNHSANSPNVLSRLLICGRCGTKLAPSNRNPVTYRKYVCPLVAGRPGCGRVSVMSTYVEEAALQAILARVASAAVSTRPVRAEARDRRWTKAADELDRAQRLLDAMARDLGDGRLSQREWLLMRPQLTERIERAHAIVMADRYDTGIKEFIGNAQLLADAWLEMPYARQRTVRRGLVDHVIVRPAVVGQRRFDLTRLTIRWRGDGPFPPFRRMHAPPPQVCLVRGCVEPNKSRGLCQMHYRRWQADGTPGTVGPTPHHWFIGRPCKAVGCAAPSRSMGWCPVHYQSWLAETATRPRCQIPECERPALAKGICLRHYTNQRNQAARALQLAHEAADPTLRKNPPCKEQGCEEKRFQLGHCAEHYQQWIQANADLPRCGWEGCERHAVVRGNCSKHELRVRYYQGKLSRDVGYPAGSAKVQALG